MNELPKIPGYRLIKKLGHGGMADVYLGVQEKLDRPVAIKIMDPILLRDEQFSIRFIKEAKTAAQLAHPNIIMIHDVGEVEGETGRFQYIVMEYLEESLSEQLKQRGPYPPEEALEIISKIAGALDYAHKKGIIHRDIKPDNLMFRPNGSVVLVDFGIARAMDSNTQLTRTGTSIGTPHYMSPEQCRGERIDGRSDIYSLGVQLYEMLTGDVPYKAENSTGIIIKHIQDPIPVLPTALNKYQPLIDAMMAKDREMRIQSGEELIRFIHSFLTEPQHGFTIPLTKPNLYPTIQSDQTQVTPPTGSSSVNVQSQSVPPPSPTPADAPSNISPSYRTSTNKTSQNKKGILMAAIVALFLVLVTLIIYLAFKDPQKPIVNNSGGINSIPQTQHTHTTGTNANGTGGSNSSGSSHFPVEITKKNTDTGDEPNQSPGNNTTEPAVNTKTPKDESKTKPKDITAITYDRKEISPLSNVKDGTIMDLPFTTKSGYLRQLHHFRMELLRPRFAPNITGQILVTLSIDEYGRINVISIDDKLEIHGPQESEQFKPVLLNRIKKRIDDIRLTPPTAKDGRPLRFKWRLSYGVEEKGRTLIFLMIKE